MGATLPDPAVPFVGHRSMINREEYVRLIEQALRKLGFSSLATELEKQSVCF